MTIETASGEGLPALAKIARTSAHRTLADRAYAALHEAIVHGTLAPGQRLPIEDVAAVLDMSPMPVREALRQLDARGLVENQPHRGSTVTQLSITDLAEVYEARLALEPLAVRHAAERIDVEEAHAAELALEALGRSLRGRSGDRWIAHTEYHFALYRAAHSRWLLRLIQPLWESAERYRNSTTVGARLDMRQREHEELLAAVLAHDADGAARILQDHLTTTANELAAVMGGETPFPARRTGKRARRASS